ncbi:MAG: hypothetical protein O2943_04850 [Actinomycetota bacterium]|nr:hypothetical protein [Actinomycetota bacterium]
MSAVGLGDSDFAKEIAGREKLMANPHMVWVEDFSDPAIRTIGGLAITMLGAIMVYVRRGD